MKHQSGSAKTQLNDIHKFKKIEHLEEKIKKQAQIATMEKQFQLVTAKYDKLVAYINAVRDHVDETHTKMLLEKFASDIIF